jgi:hypothetical protein
MSEPRIGRVLVASLHQAIADIMPTRLEFYENWLNIAGLREGTIGLAPLSAVLSFLRSEGDAYPVITARAGQYAADWTVNSLPAFERRVIRALPPALRVRAALRTARSLVRATYPGSRAIVRLRRGTASVDLRGSLFCEVREASTLPLCGFYAAAIEQVLELFSLRADAQVSECRAATTRQAGVPAARPVRGGVERCLLSVVVQGARADEPAAAA